MSDLSQELMLSITPTLHRKAMGRKKGGGNWKGWILDGGVQQRRNIENGFKHDLLYVI